MIKAVKYIIGFLTIILVSIVAYTTTYYFVEIKPNKVAIQKLIDSYELNSSSYETLEKMAVTEEGRNGIANYVAHSIAVEKTGKGFRNYWHFKGTHWHLWIRLLYSEREIYKMWLALAPYGGGRGMKEASMYHFKKPLEQTSCYELAQLVVMVKAPSKFKPGSINSENRIKERGVVNVCNS